jgi:hypothetical protein
MGFQQSLPRQEFASVRYASETGRTTDPAAAGQER